MSEGIESVEWLAPGDRKAAAHVLLESFRDYPYMRFVLEPSPTDYETSLETLIRFMVDVPCLGEQPVLGVREAEAVVAVATVEEPVPKERPGPSGRPPEVERLFERLEAELGSVAFERMAQYEKVAYRGRPVEPHHHLDMLGVLPGSQGAGHGRRLVDAVKDLAGRHPGSCGVSLNTEVAQNVALYEHLGFVVVGEGDVGELHTWCMLWRWEEAAS